MPKEYKLSESEYKAYQEYKTKKDKKKNGIREWLDKPAISHKKTVSLSQSMGGS